VLSDASNSFSRRVASSWVAKGVTDHEVMESTYAARLLVGEEFFKSSLGDDCVDAVTPRTAAIPLRPLMTTFALIE